MNVELLTEKLMTHKTKILIPLKNYYYCGKSHKFCFLVFAPSATGTINKAINQISNKSRYFEFKIHFNDFSVTAANNGTPNQVKIPAANTSDPICAYAEKVESFPRRIAPPGPCRFTRSGCAVA